MTCQERIIALRKSTGMNRKQFGEYFEIPYRTVTDWERDDRHAPEYVMNLLEYYINHELVAKKEAEEA